MNFEPNITSSPLYLINSENYLDQLQTSELLDLLLNIPFLDVLKLYSIDKRVKNILDHNDDFWKRRIEIDYNINGQKLRMQAKDHYFRLFRSKNRIIPVFEDDEYIGDIEVHKDDSIALVAEKAISLLDEPVNLHISLIAPDDINYINGDFKTLSLSGSSRTIGRYWDTDRIVLWTPTIDYQSIH